MFGIREKEQSEETIKTAYDNVIGEIYPYREPLEKLVYTVKRAAVLAGIVAVCTYVTTAGEKDPEPEPKKILNISVIDELPTESRSEFHVPGEDYRNSESESGNTAIRFDWYQDSIYLRQEDGSVREKRGRIIIMNTVQFFVPDEGMQRYGTFYLDEMCHVSHIYRAEEESTVMQYVEFSDTCPDFNAGIDTVRSLMSEGYLNEQMTDFADLFLQDVRYGHEYILRLLDAGLTFSDDDKDMWWHVEYGFYAKAADTGEEFMLATVYISRNIMRQGKLQEEDATYLVKPSIEGIRQFTEDPAKNMGAVQVQRVEGDLFASEESVRHFVEEQETDFFLPEGVHETINWNCYEQQEFYYDYLVWQGETAHYEVTLAIPLMDKRDEGYYLTSVIRKEAEDKAACHNMLLGVMQTFRDEKYLHVVKEGESLCKIAEKYMGTQDLYTFLQLYDDEERAFVVYDDINNPDFIYPGQKVYVPLGRAYTKGMYIDGE